jgi:hypothetical protein
MDDGGTHTQDVGLHQLAQIYPRLHKLHNDMLRPGAVPIPLICVWGTGIPTAKAYYYDVDDLKAISAPEPTTVYSENGDGTVNLKSLQVRSSGLLYTLAMMCSVVHTIACD